MRAIASLSLALIIGMSPLAVAQESHPVFHSFDFPGATNTQATSMTPWGDIVGRYFNPDGSQHGFLWRRGAFSSIDFPGALITEADWINDHGVIVGYYNNGDPNHPNHGYKLTDGRFETIDYPGSGLTFLGGIGNDGEIVMPACFLPKDSEQGLQMFSTGAPAKVTSLKVYKLKSASTLWLHQT